VEKNKGTREKSQSPPGTSHGQQLSQSLLRGVELLLMFSEKRPLLGVAELADLTGLSRPTTHRYASTLVQLGYMEQGFARKYRLASGAADPGAGIIREIRHLLPAREVLEDLRDETGYTASMGTLDGTRVLYLYRFFGHRSGQHMIDRELRVGAHVPAYCTALGKVMLASLPDADRRTRIAMIHLVPQGPHTTTEHKDLLTELDRVDPHAPTVSDEEFVIGGRSIAILISGRGGKQPMAIDVTVPSDAYTGTQLLNRIGPKLRQAANLIVMA
jgi:IclR family pca regulon transcriptional regulator